MFVKKSKYRAWFFQKQHGTFKLRKKKRFNPDTKPTIKYKGKPYEPIVDNPSFSNGLKDIFFFEIGSKSQLNYHEVMDSDAEIKDLLYGKEIIVQAFKSLGEKALNITWLHLVVVGLAMFLGGWIMGTYLPVGFIP